MGSFPSDEISAGAPGPPEWLQYGLANAFDDPPEASAIEDSEASAGGLRPPDGWRHALPNDGMFTPVQWTRPLKCACVDWLEPRSQLCCCAPASLFAARALAPGSHSHHAVDAVAEGWERALLALLDGPTSCPHDLRGWWWLDGDPTHSGELITLHDAEWRGARHALKATAAGVARPRTARAVYTGSLAALHGTREEYVFDEGYRSAYIAPGASRWFFRVSEHEFRAVEFASGRSNAIRAMHRVRRVLLPAPAAEAGSPPIQRLAALDEFLARARAPRPHADDAVLCGCVGAPTCGCADVGPLERLDNVVVAVNPRMQLMWRT